MQEEQQQVLQEESIAYETCDVLTAMEKDSGVRLNELKVDGGASANNFLLQTQADLINATVVRPSCLESTAMGAAFLAGLAVGYWTSRDELRTVISIDRVYKPEIEAAERDERLQGWRKAVGRSFDWVD